ncbi:MAG: AraC family transcriptional regulator [Lachnospiraceae bacterium]
MNYQIEESKYRVGIPIGRMEISDNLLETVEYNTPTTPIKAAVSHLSDYPGGLMPCHWHKELECIVVLDGVMHYYVNDKTYPLRKGEGLIVNTNRLHLCGPAKEEDHILQENTTSTFETDDCSYAVLLLQPDSLRFNRKMEEKYINPLLFDLNSDVFYLNGTKDWHQTVIDQILSIFYAVMEKEPCFELTSQSLFFSLWSTLYEHSIAKNGFDFADTDPMSPLKKMMSYIHNHFQEPITLQDIAEAGMMCQSKCCRLFKENLRQSPIAYLQNYRIQHGIYLLEHTDMNITEIALECGFHGASYFTETFRKINGIPPKEYRRK